MLDQHTINHIKNLLTNGKTKAAADVLLDYTSHHSKEHYETAVLLKNRIASIQQQDAEGIVSLADKNMEWARISKSLLTVVIDLEEATEQSKKEEFDAPPTHTPIKATKSSYFSSNKILLVLGLMSVPILFYLLKPVSITPKTFNLEIQAFKDDKNSVFIEGVKIYYLIQGFEKSNAPLILNTSGKAFLTDIPDKFKAQKVNACLVDTAFLALTHQEIVDDASGKILKIRIQPKTTTFKGKVVRVGFQPLANALIKFGTIAQATTNAQGEYSVDLPLNIVNTNLEITISLNQKVLKNRDYLMVENVLAELKVE
jgi:Effector-associated domain 11